MYTNVPSVIRGSTSTTRASIAIAPGTDRRLVGGGARRADWLDKTSQLVLPNVNYFQVVFTLPDRLSGLILGNRRALYDLLFHTSWRSLDETLRSTGQFQPAAQLVLHT